MEIILKETIDNLGLEGDIVNVKPGYARNYLIPQKKAETVTKASLARLKQEQQAIAARREEEQKKAASLASQLESKTVTITRRVGDENRLFGSVSTKDIADELAQSGIIIDRRSILLADPIKSLGETKVTVKVGYQMTTTLSVLVVGEGGEVAAPEEEVETEEAAAEAVVEAETEAEAEAKEASEEA